MKKCASCTKDLPDAALHCVFCGAKQAPGPVAAPANAKTVMGYGGQELDLLRQQAAAANAARPAPGNPPAAPYGAPPPGAPAPYGAPPQQGGYGAAPNAANAATMFVPPGQGPQIPSGGNPMGGPQMGGPMGGMGGPQMGGPMGGPMGGMGGPQMGGPQPMYNSPVPVPMAPAPIQPIASAAPPYMNQGPARAGRPIEPWQDTLRMMMFIWGALILVAFATPLSLDPMVFNWDTIIHGEGKMKLVPLIMAAVGLLSIVIGSIPMPAGPRGAIALALGLAGILVPVLLVGMPPWQVLATIGGFLLLVPSLFAREEYRDAPLPRILITIGAIAVLAPLLIPRGGSLPLIREFTAIIDAPGKAKILAILNVGFLALVVMSLLAWLPSPSNGMGKLLGWGILMFPLVLHVATLFLVGDPSDLTKTPFTGGTSWIVTFGHGLPVGYMALVGWGGATVIGKQLE